MKKIIPFILTLLVIYSCNQDEVPQLQNNDCYLCGTWKLDSGWMYMNGVKQTPYKQMENITYVFTSDSLIPCRNDNGVISCENQSYTLIGDTLNCLFGPHIVSKGTDSLTLYEMSYSGNTVTYITGRKYYKVN